MRYNKAMKKVGRPTAITPPVIAKLTEAFKLDVTVEEACLYAGISKDTYYRKCKADQGFTDEMQNVRSFASMLARKSVIREMENDGALALKYLERKKKEEFSPRIEQKIEGNIMLELVKGCEEDESVDWDSSQAHLEYLGKSAS